MCNRGVNLIRSACHACFSLFFFPLPIKLKTKVAEGCATECRNITFTGYFIGNIHRPPWQCLSLLFFRNLDQFLPSSNWLRPPILQLGLGTSLRGGLLFYVGGLKTPLSDHANAVIFCTFVLRNAVNSSYASAERTCYFIFIHFQQSFPML